MLNIWQKQRPAVTNIHTSILVLDLIKKKRKKKRQGHLEDGLSIVTE